MSIEVDRPTVPCIVCSAQVTELRRGRCWSCYLRWSEARPVGKGAVCAVCSDPRRDNLRLTEFHSHSVVLCHICATRTVKLPGVPGTLEGLRSALQRERRISDQREDNLDRRLYPRERRVGERRAAPRVGHSDTDPHIELSNFDDLADFEMHIDENDIEILELTQVRESPQAPQGSQAQAAMMASKNPTE